MNRFLKTISLSCCALLVGLSACRNHELTSVSPLGPGAPSGTLQPAGDDLIVGVSKKHTLVKHGNTSLIYNPDGTLQKVTTGNRVTTYSYGPGKISFLTTENGKKTDDGNFYLDANGRCLQSDANTYYVQDGINFIQINPLKYEYDGSGRLSKRYSTIYQQQRIEFFYDANGDLAETKEYGFSNTLIQRNTYFYATERGAALISDRHSLNPVGIRDMDPYLRVFGKRSKHLVHRLKIEQPVYDGVNTDHRYKYTLDGDGFVIQRNKTVTANGLLLESVPYEYLITDIPIN
ncbi:DUF4595 domain-containing protein [Larkinella soli]|uniref:DUF4595 domain-containing protein n=1 Tax=Larkinella soli TaxID=1770527 RepID=UPI000FFBC340|nr:DUF4595 domain-containing protein [Larkinella soli]